MRVRLVVIAILCAAVGCGRAPSRPVEVDLTTLAPQGRDGRRPASAAGVTGMRQLRVMPDRPLDLFLRVPAEARLVFSLPAGMDPGSLELEAESAARRAPLHSESGDHGERVVSLAGFDEQVIRLRFASRATTPLTLVNPRVVGVDVLFAPIVDRRPELTKGRLNVVLYVVDTMRADRLSAYGYQRETSPRLTALAARGLLFERAYAGGSSTWPSITALYASRLPSEVGSLTPDGRAGKTLAEVFHDAGYATAAFQANFTLLEERGFARGFETYELFREETPDGLPKCVRADAIQERALAWVRAHRDQPFFLYIQIMDVHEYDPPAPWRGKFETPRPAPDAAAMAAAWEQLAKLTPDQVKGLRHWKVNPDRYDETVAYADHEIGRLVDALGDLGVAERTAIVITADHGEPLGQRGQIFHGRTLNEEIVRVPLIMLIPGQSRPERVGEVVSLMDLAPTLADLAGLPVPEQFAGRSLLQPRTRLRPPSALGEQPPFARGNETKGRTFSWYAREGDWKLLMDPDKVVLHDLSTDPGELHDVSGQHPVETGYLVAALTQRAPPLSGAAAPMPAEALTPEARAKLESALRALGYVQ